MLEMIVTSFMYSLFASYSFMVLVEDTVSMLVVSKSLMWGFVRKSMRLSINKSNIEIDNRNDLIYK